jgi:carboxymethylenebutenolidase
MTALDVPHDVQVYPDAGHAFMSPKPSLLTLLVKLVRLDFRPESATDAWQRIFTFFGEYLR